MEVICWICKFLLYGGINKIMFVNIGIKMGKEVKCWIIFVF